MNSSTSTKLGAAGILLILLGMAVPSVASTQTTNSSGRPEFSAFKIIPDRNIFNPRRYARSAQSPRETRRAAQVDSISLVGIMSYEKGPFAFFDGSSSEYRKVLKAGDSIAGYKLIAVAPNSATLATTTNKVELRVGMRLRREDNGQWQMGGSPEEGGNSVSPASKPTGKPSSTSRVSKAPTPSTTSTNAEPSEAVAPAEPDIAAADPPQEAVTTNAEPAAASESTESDPVLRRLMERRNQELNR